MSTVNFVHVSSGPLQDVTAEFGPGLHVIVGAQHDGTLELLRLATGRRHPRKGKVLVNGVDPHKTPGIRSRIATSLGSRFEENVVQQALQQRSKLAPGAHEASETLKRAGLEHLLTRPCAGLTEAEHRGLMLAMALDTANPAAVLLHEPLDEGTLLDRAFVLAALRQHAQAAPVVCTTARPELVSELTDTALWLEAGRLRRTTSPTTAPAVRPGVPPALMISCTDAPRLARALACHDIVVELRFARGEGVVEARGEELEALCLLVCRCARDEEVTLHQMTQLFPELPEVRAVHAAMARTAYERAYGVLRPPTQGAPG